MLGITFFGAEPLWHPGVVCDCFFRASLRSCCCCHRCRVVVVIVVAALLLSSLLLLCCLSASESYVVHTYCMSIHILIIPTYTRAYIHSYIHVCLRVYPSILHTQISGHTASGMNGFQRTQNALLAKAFSILLPFMRGMLQNRVGCTL